MYGSVPEPEIAKEQQSTAAAARTIVQLFQRIDGEPTQEFGIKISGFLRQHLAGKGDLAYLLDLGRIHQEGHVGALANPRDRLKGVTLITHMLLIADGLF